MTYHLTKATMFADDTTLYDEDHALNKLICKFNKVIDSLMTLCTYNKMDINWTKTCYMIITNKRLQITKAIKHNDKIQIEAVLSFKLLRHNRQQIKLR